MFRKALKQRELPQPFQFKELLHEDQRKFMRVTKVTHLVRSNQLES